MKSSKNIRRQYELHLLNIRVELCVLINSHRVNLHSSYLNVKQVSHTDLKLLGRDLNSQPLISSTNTEPFSRTGKIIELCFEYLSVGCIWLCIYHVTYSFYVNLHSIDSEAKWWERIRIHDTFGFLMISGGIEIFSSYLHLQPETCFESIQKASFFDWFLNTPLLDSF